MSAERWLQFKSPSEVRAYLKDAPEIGFDDAFETAFGRDFGCEFLWRDDRLEVGYGVGVDSGELAKVVCRELARRFEVTRLGSSGTGWYEDPPTHGKASFKTWTEWLRACQSYEEGTHSGILPETERRRTLLEAHVERIFLDLDARR